MNQLWMKFQPVCPSESKSATAKLTGCAKAEGLRVESRRVQTRQEKELRKCGYTEGCPGCTTAATGSKAKGHSDACRQRVEEKMEAEEEGRERLSASLLRKQMFSPAATTATAAAATATMTGSSGVCKTQRARSTRVSLHRRWNWKSRDRLRQVTRSAEEMTPEASHPAAKRKIEPQSQKRECEEYFAREVACSSSQDNSALDVVQLVGKVTRWTGIWDRAENYSDRCLLQRQVLAWLREIWTLAWLLTCLT